MLCCFVFGELRLQAGQAPGWTDVVAAAAAAAAAAAVAVVVVGGGGAAAAAAAAPAAAAAAAAGGGRGTLRGGLVCLWRCQRRQRWKRPGGARSAAGAHSGG